MESMLRLLRNYFFVFSTFLILALPCVSHAIGSSLPPPEYFKAQKYPTCCGWHYNNYWANNDSDIALIIGQQDNKLKVFIFEKIELAKAKGKEQPDLLYESPELPIHPSIYNSRTILKSRIRYNQDHQAFFIAYGYESDPQSDFDYSSSSSINKTFSVHGYLLIPNIKNDSTHTDDFVEHDYQVASFEGTLDHQQVDNFTVTIKTPVEVTDTAQQERMKAVLNMGWFVYNWNSGNSLTRPRHLAFNVAAQESEQIKTLRKLYVQVATTQYGSSDFYKYFALLDDFFKNNSYQSLDPENQHPHYVLWLTDYGYWLLRQNRTAEAMDVLSETIKRDSNNATKYLTLANAQLQYAKKRTDHRDFNYYNAAAQDSYREYCMLMQQQNKLIKPDTEQTIKLALGVDALTPRTCIPYMFLIDAIFNGDLEKAQSLIDQGLDPNLVVYRNYERSALEFAILKNDAAMVELLLKNGANPDVVVGKDNGAVGIFYHAYRNLRDRAEKIKDEQPLDTKVADLLLQYGANINAQTLNESYVLVDAVKDDAPDSVIRYLLQNGADPDFKKVTTYHTPLIAALQKRQTSIAMILLTEGHVNVNNASHGSVSTENGQRVYTCKSPLYFYLYSLQSRGGMVGKDDMDLLKLLFAKGADTTAGGPSRDENCTDKNGWTGIEELIRKFQSTELRCEIDKHRPTDVPVNEMNPLCPIN